MSFSEDTSSSRAYSITGSETVIPWLPLPELMTTAIGQPFILASEPAAAAALALNLTSQLPQLIIVLPTSSPQPPFNPFCEIAVLSFICISMTSFTSSRSTVSAYSRISLTFIRDLSVFSLNSMHSLERRMTSFFLIKVKRECVCWISTTALSSSLYASILI